LLRPFGTKERPGVPEFDRQLTLRQAIFNYGSTHTRGALRAQGQSSFASVVEGIHLFGNKIALLANTTSENLYVLEDR
jgi:hypothetical protein